MVMDSTLVDLTQDCSVYDLKLFVSSVQNCSGGLHVAGTSLELGLHEIFAEHLVYTLSSLTT